MSREAHVPFCEGLLGKFQRSTLLTVLMLVYFHFSRTFVSRDYYLKAMAAKRALKENNEL